MNPEPDEANVGGADPVLLAPWRILVVDDEPEVLEITRLVLGRLTYQGRSLELCEAQSAAQAASIMERNADIAVILLDVVMESDDAGLALVRHVRDRLGNRNVQILLRTGQPGVAPEASVTVDYEINGYFLKTELTAQRLQSIVTCALRTFALTTGVGPAIIMGATDRPVQLPDLDPERLRLMGETQFSLSSGQVAGMSVQAQWWGGHGWVGSPEVLAASLPVALMEELDRVALERLGAWWKAQRTQHRQSSRVSISPVTGICHPQSLPLLLERYASRVGLMLTDLDLRLPDALLFRDDDETLGTYRALANSGVSITLEDVGWGALSLPRIQRLGPDRISIHPELVRAVKLDHEKTAISRTVIALAHTLGVAVIAKGVESEMDAQFFKWEGCDLAQGPYFEEPVLLHPMRRPGNNTLH